MLCRTCFSACSLSWSACWAWSAAASCSSAAMACSSMMSCFACMQPNYESDSKCQMTVAELSRCLQGTAVSQIQAQCKAWGPCTNCLANAICVILYNMPCNEYLAACYDIVVAVMLSTTICGSSDTLMIMLCKCAASVIPYIMQGSNQTAVRMQPQQCRCIE